MHLRARAQAAALRVHAHWHGTRAGDMRPVFLALAPCQLKGITPRARAGPHAGARGVRNDRGTGGGVLAPGPGPGRALHRRVHGRGRARFLVGEWLRRYFTLSSGPTNAHALQQHPRAPRASKNVASTVYFRTHDVSEVQSQNDTPSLVQP